MQDNHIVSESFFRALLKAVLENPNYGYNKEISYTDRKSGSMVLKINHKDQHLTMSRMGEQDDTLEFHGPLELIQEFLAEMAIEASTILADELCGSLFNEEGARIFNDIVRKNISEAIRKSISDCQHLLTGKIA